MARRVEELEKLVVELQRRLAVYENAHTPPSQKRFPEKKTRDENEGDCGRGRPPGFEGSTRKQPTPTRRVIALAESCSECGAKLGPPVGFETRVVEEIPEPQPIIVTEFKLAQYDCGCCGKRVTAKHSDCPENGVFGPRALSQVALLKYHGRLPCKLVCKVLERDFRLQMTPATVLAVNGRVANALEDEYALVLQRIRAAAVLHVDETGASVGGVRYWLWVFTTPSETLVVIRQSRGKKVLREVLGGEFGGFIVCDGHKAYSNFTDRIQRCWAHLLREAKYAAEFEVEAIPLRKALRKLYKRLVSELAGNPSFETRLRLFRNARQALRYWLAKRWKTERVRKLVEKIRNGFKHWFTFVLIPGMEPTNNRAERALREHVVLRKIIGALRSRNGVRQHEVITSVLASWRQREPCSESELRERLTQSLRGS